MKQSLLFLIAMMLCTGSFAQINVTGTNGVDGNYTSLTNAGGVFAALNGTPQTGAGVYINITSDVTNESGTYALNAGAWTSFLIKPSGFRTVSGTVAGAPMIDFNGADNILINGYADATRSLTFSNLSTSAVANTSTIRFINDASGNTIIKCSILGSSTVTFGTDGGTVCFSTGIATGNDNNAISYCKIGPAGSNLPSKGIYSSGTTTNAALANSNVSIYSCEIFDYFLATSCAGVYAAAGNSDWTMSDNRVYQTASRTFTADGTMYGLCFSDETCGNNIQITNNTIGYANAAGTGTLTLTQTGSVQASFIGIYHKAMPVATVASNINLNVISDISMTSYCGNFYAIYNGSGASSNTININNNTVKNITVNTCGPFLGIYWGSASNMTVTGNTVRDVTQNGQGWFYGLSSDGSTANENVSGNTIYNFSKTNTAASSLSCGIYQHTGAGIKTYENNVIHNISATKSQVLYGIYIFHGTTVAINNNKIYSIASNSGTGFVNGIRTGPNVTTSNIFKNTICDLSATGTSPLVYGISIGGGTTSNIYNNLVGNLTSAAGTSATDVIRGINIESTIANSNVNVYYNSVYINATSSGANFGTAGIYHTASATATTATLDLRNNIIVNTSTANGSGYTVAFRRSSGSAGMLANYAMTSSNNDFYAGNPAVATNLIYYDGTSSAQTLAAYKSGVFTAGTVAPRDMASFTENPPWLSTTCGSTDFLHISTAIATQVESGAQPLTGITDDFDGNARNATYPDAGADEFAGIALDLTGPVIGYTALGTTLCTGNRTLTATITDPHNVNVTAGTRPRIYFKKSGNLNMLTSTNDNTTNGWKYTETTNVSSPFGFTIDVSLIYGGVAATDIIQYFVVAQDMAAAHNVSINSGIFTALPSTVVLTAAAFPVTGAINSYTILGGIPTYVTIGASGTYTSLTGATNSLFAAINAGGLTGNTTATILDATVNETGATALNAMYYGCAGTYTLTIKPAAGVTATLAGEVASGALIKLNGADYVTFDGSNSGGTDKSLTIINSSTTSPAAISLVSLGAGAGASNNTIKNCNISTGVSSTASYGISVGGDSPGTAGSDNDNVTLQDNSFTVATISIYASGTASVSSGGMDNLLVTGNSVNTNTTIPAIGIKLGYGVNCTITRNTISVQTSAGTVVGISLETGFVSSTVNANNIIKVSTDTWGSRGIAVGTGSLSSNLTISNNFISGVIGHNYSYFGYSSVGIGIGILGIYTNTNIVAGGINLFNNSVNMYGDYDNTVGCLTAAMYGGSETASLNLKDNIFVNSLNNTNASGSASKNYAIYSEVANTAFTEINYNDYYVNGAQGVLGYLAADQNTLAAWKIATGKDGASVSGDPLFVTNADLHIASPSVANNAGVAIASVTTDIDGETRNATTPDVGADEFTVIYCSGAVGGTASGTASFCDSGTPAITASGYSAGAYGYTYQWEYSNDNFGSDIHDFSGQTNPAALSTGVVTATTSYRLRVSCPTSASTAWSTIVTITITTPTSAASGNSPVCEGATLHLAGASNGSSFNWTGPNGFASSEQNPDIPSVTLAAGGTYSFTATLNGCPAISTTDVIVNTLPSAVSLTPLAPTINAGDIQQLDAGGGVVTGVVILHENFNGTASGWTITSESSSPVISNWHFEPVPYSYAAFNNFTTVDGGNFALSNSDAGGPGTITNTNLASPVFSTIGYSSAALKFEHVYQYYPGDIAAIEISTDGGSTWTVLIDYSPLGNQGDYTSTVNASIDLAGYLNQPSLTIRFNYISSWGFLWLIDDVKITGDGSSLTWTPVTDLFTDAGATVQYIAGIPSTTVWAKPASTITYTVTATSPTGCSTSADATVNVNSFKTLAVKAFLEGLYNGAGAMNTAIDGNTGLPEWGSGIADKVTLELHNASDYSAIEYSSGPVDLSTAGIATVTDIPLDKSGLYYITIKHRNSLETTSAAPVPFTARNVSFDFTTSSGMAYGDNMRTMGAVYAIWGGDVNQDGIVDGADMSGIYNSSQPPALIGYYPQDVNGDGITDGADMSLIYNNSQPPPVEVKKPADNPGGGFTCGDALAVMHLASGGVAPVDKSVAYGTVSGIPGAPLKCWITRNLGASRQAGPGDDTEASAGWYWQFDTKQGYKYDGTTRTPNTAWTTAIDENSGWKPANDPCSLELGANWRIPTSTEWSNIKTAGSWTNWNGPFYSDLRLHPAGFLLYSDGLLYLRGTYGGFWSSTQNNTTEGLNLSISSGDCNMYPNSKADGFSLRCLRETCSAAPAEPTSGTSVSSPEQIAWNWGAVADAAGYKWNTTNDYAGATDMGASTTQNETGLACNTAYTRYVWAYNGCGSSTATTMSQATLSCPSVCGSSFTINHAEGAVAPVSKTVTYGTITNIPGETSKCWITSNLGADHQAASVDDDTEASAGWYWQYNRKQGYKHDGVNRTPNTEWITNISESSDWTVANDPCSLELGAGWRIPSYTEWTNVAAAGSWTNYNGPWNSGLKMHAAGFLHNSDGSLYGRGFGGFYRSSDEVGDENAFFVYFNNGNIYVTADLKAHAFSVRCVRDF